MPSHSIFLVDNGSLRPDATFALRALASALSGHLDKVIEPVSLLHSHKIAAKDLAGEPATIVKRVECRRSDGLCYIASLPRAEPCDHRLSSKSC